MDGTATDAMKSDARFRLVVETVVCGVLNNHPTLDEERWLARRIATEAAAAMLAAVYDGDAEIARLRLERDAFRTLANDALRRAPVPATVVPASRLDRSPR